MTRARSAAPRHRPPLVRESGAGTVPRRSGRDPAGPSYAGEGPGAPARAGLAAVAALLAALASAPTSGQPARGEDCVGFDPGNTAMSRQGGTWILRDGSHSLMAFGDERDEARRALRVIRHYGLDRQCFVARPDPSMQYFLAGGRAPTGSLPGEDCLEIDPGRLDVARAGGRWKIVEGKSWVMDFGGSRAEARRALSVIRKHGFRRMCYVGRPDPSMTYFKASEAAPGPEAPDRPDRPRRPRPDRPAPDLPDAPGDPVPSELDEDCVSFDAGRLRVRRVGGRWKIVEGAHQMLDFGDERDEARKALRIIRARGFGRMCFVGRPDPSMTYFTP